MWGNYRIETFSKEKTNKKQKKNKNENKKKRYKKENDVKIISVSKFLKYFLRFLYKYYC